MKRARECNNPAPECGGSTCEGDNFEIGECDAQCCVQEDGGWGEWVKQGGCSCNYTVGEGTQEWNRQCDSPAPKCNGSPCDGYISESRACGEGECCMTVNGSWSDWNDLGGCECNYTTGEATVARMRSCNNPEPACLGAPCEGNTTGRFSCESTECCQTLDGGWGEWEGVCGCDYTTGTGNMTQFRRCDTPSPSCYGKFCEGDVIRTVGCDDECCEMVHGGWAEWSEWSKCKCNHGNGTGIQGRERNCTAPEPACYGEQCPEDEDYEERQCDEECCTTEHGSWAEWGEWMCFCDMVKRSGYTERHRACSDPAPVCGGDMCEGSSNHTVYTTKKKK